MLPFLRWVKATLHYHLDHMDACLPQCDTHRDQREDELKIKREDFEYMQQPGYIRSNRFRDATSLSPLIISSSSPPPKGKSLATWCITKTAAVA